MYIDKTNEVMMNYYKKQEIIKAKERFEEEHMSIAQVLKLANKEFIKTVFISKSMVNGADTVYYLPDLFNEKLFN